MVYSQFQDNKITLRLILISIVFSSSFTSCLDLSKCSNNVVGKYKCNNLPEAANILELKYDGKFVHTFSFKKESFIDSGNWEFDKKNSCIIEFSNWKNYNEFGESYQNFGSSVLFINGKYLSISPDGYGCSDFIRIQ